MTLDPKHRPTSMFGEIVDWMLAPIMIIWPISVAVIYNMAYGIADSVYDQKLNTAVVALARQVSYDRGRLKVNMPAPAVAILKADESDEILYQVRGLKNEVISGDGNLPVVDFNPEIEPREVYFQTQWVKDKSSEMRIAYSFAQVPGLTGAVLVQVAESEDKRKKLAGEIISGVLGMQFVVVPLALVLVWFGLERGIVPLNELRDKIRGRRSQDLAPIALVDVPEEVRPLLQSINELMARLLSMLNAQQRFVADAAHQLRTPLAGLRTQAELALRQKEMPEIMYAMQQIALSADNASRLVNQLLSLARAESDTPPPFAPVDFTTLVRETAKDWVPKSLERHIDLGFESTGQACMVDGNAILLRELVNNLVDNSLRYTPEGGRVTARLVVSDFVNLEVEDDGIGIEKADRELVFERFYRVLGTGSDGSGLGLSIVREIADLHGANVLLMPNPAGKGTVVRVVFPHGSKPPVRLAA